MPKPRTKENKKLPRYWRFKYNAYFFRVPKRLQGFYDGRTEIVLGHTLAEAYRKYAEFQIFDEKVTTLAQLLDRYRIEVVSEHESPNTRKSKEISLDNIKQVIGDNPVTAITPQAIYKYRDYMAKEKSKKQANLDLEVLSHAFTKSIEWGVCSDHPMTNKKVTKFRLKSRDRYVEDWELQEWSKVANPFLVVYVILKGVTGLRQQDLLTIQNSDITDTELRSVNLKTEKTLRFPLWKAPNVPTTGKVALDLIHEFYGKNNSKWLFHTRKGDCYYNMEKRSASGFHSIWQRSMRKAIKETNLIEKFTEHDLRAKASSDLDTDFDAQKLLAHSSASLTNKHYRRRGKVVDTTQGFLL